MSQLMTHKGYSGNAEFSLSDKVFHGKILAINDLVTYEAENVNDLLAAFKEAVEDYLETCLELGKEPNKSYKGSFNVRIGSELHKEVSLSAEKKGISLNTYIKQILQKSIAKEPRPGYKKNQPISRKAKSLAKNERALKAVNKAKSKSTQKNSKDKVKVKES